MMANQLQLLQGKVQRQADELATLHATLEDALAYGSLCEQRILELAPRHPLPVSATHLESLSRVTQQPTRRAPLPPNALSAEARARRLERECTDQVMSLKRHVRELEAQRADLGAKLKVTRADLAAKDREAAFLATHAQHLAQRLAQSDAGQSPAAQAEPRHTARVNAQGAASAPVRPRQVGVIIGTELERACGRRVCACVRACVWEL